jgi:hypothetical protein
VSQVDVRFAGVTRLNCFAYPRREGARISGLRIALLAELEQVVREAEAGQPRQRA